MEDNSKNRVVRWTQKLLDLSLRNRLLNARDSKQILLFSFIVLPPPGSPL